MWKELEIFWQESDHPWNEFGSETAPPHEDDDSLHARGLVVWRKTTLAEFVEKIVGAVDATNKYLDDKNLLTGFTLAFVVANLFPLHLKIVKEDAVADKFLSLIQREKGQQFILKKDLGEGDSLNSLVAYFVQNSLLTDAHDRFVVNGRVLNRAFADT